MAKLFLVRHGQASFGASNYDALSDLGRQQAQWLGEYFSERELVFSRMVSGELQRQKDTTLEILAGLRRSSEEFDIHHGLNEYDSEVLYSAFTRGSDTHEHQSAHAHQKADRVGYWRTFRSAYEAWVDDNLSGDHESWADFGARIQAAIAHACEGTEKEDAVLVVTSGGVIGTMVSRLLNAAPRSAIELNFQVRNTSFCEIVVGRRQMRLISFNSIPHLDRPDRRQAITFV
jgi:broad specificity phosphatase PhoE